MKPNRARQRICGALVALVVAVTGMAPAGAQEVPPGGQFVDDDGLAAEGYIEAIAAADVTRGCNPPENDRFCPERTLTRAEMASIFVRALDLATSSSDHFIDDEESVHEANIDALAGAGITVGCNPPANDRFCPDRSVTRGEMAAFLARAFAYTDGAASDAFEDDNDSVFEADINRIHAAGITTGCGDGLFCPYSPLPRSEMAVFVANALQLAPLVPPVRPPPPHPDVGEGKRIIYSNSKQQVWLIDEAELLVDTYLVSGRKGIPAAGTYEVYSKSINAWAGHGGITMRHMVRFAKGPRLPYGFHSIPRGRDGMPLQTEEELGLYRSGGCVRQTDAKAEALFAWAPIGTTVIVLP